ncbi:hypothetical protein [Desulfosporosinus nitroreducens]|uniref:Uncharacterized protein n=1 Tax=Desulfosporosinus nitroreducens TaxID=2018668 RepID=A0ABT8QVL2_9FIRM|nr:hypothetical protein [Desulfosporosinus nitroreducens]MDO0825388.1 hypothetical protein [Desulfosporosinus nitroreducens]
MDLELLKNGLHSLEWYVLREVERLVAGTGTACPVTLYKRMELCIRLNKELGLIQNLISSEEYIDQCGYDKEFIKTYIDMVNNHTEETCPNELYWHTKK